MLLLLSTALLAPAVFKGGNVTDLAASIAESARSNVVIAVLDKPNYKGFAYDPEDLTSMARAIQAATSLRQAAGVDLAYHPGLIPPSFVRIPPIARNWNPPAFRYANMPQGARKDEEITWATGPDEAFRLSNLRGAFSKPLSFHWTQEPYAIVANVKEMPETDFLRYAAKAVGGKLKTVKNAYRIDFDPEQFRQRARNLFASVPRGQLQSLGIRDRANFDLSLSAIGIASSAHLAQAFASSGSQTVIPLGAGQIGIVQSRLASRFAEESARLGDMAQGREGRRGGVGREIRQLSMVDLRQGAAIILHGDFRAEVEAITVDPFGRPTGRVRF